MRCCQAQPGGGVGLLTARLCARGATGDPILLPQGRLGTVFRDPSIVWHSGWFHLAYTTELCVGLERCACGHSTTRCDGQTAPVRAAPRQPTA